MWHAFAISNNVPYAFVLSGFKVATFHCGIPFSSAITARSDQGSASRKCSCPAIHRPAIRGLWLFLLGSRCIPWFSSSQTINNDYRGGARVFWRWNSSILNKMLSLQMLKRRGRRSQMWFVQTLNQLKMRTGQITTEGPGTGNVAWRWASLPVDPRALDAEQHPQVDGGPAGSRLAAVAAELIAGEALHPLQEAFATSSRTPVNPLAALSGFTGRVDAAGGGRCRPVQALQRRRQALGVR